MFIIKQPIWSSEKEKKNAVENFVTNDDLTKLYESWNKMYILNRSEEFSENDLEKFNVSK